MRLLDDNGKIKEGEVLFEGKDLAPLREEEMSKIRGNEISMIFQEMSYVPEMTVEENLFLGNLPVKKFGNVNWKEVRQRTQELLVAENLPYSPTTPLKDLTISDIQMLEIIKAISYKSDIIIMDEPTSAITLKEVEKLFVKIRDLKARGVSIIYISHKLDEVFQIADDITVLRDGTVVESHPKEELDIETVIALMVGRKLTTTFPKEQVPIGEDMLQVENFNYPNLFHNVNFHVKKGEILGFAGLMGSGRTEVMRSLFVLLRYNTGKWKDIKIK